MSLNDSLTLLMIAALYNVVVFCVYWWDKVAAGNNDWRVSESTLLGLALLAGSPGAVLAQRLLRHKTRKEPFRSQLARIVAAHGVIAFGALICLVYPRAPFLLFQWTIQTFG